MKEFKTNPTVWSVDGNVIGEELGYLNNLPPYSSHFAKIVQGNPVNFGGYNHNSLILTFDTDNLLDRETSRTLNIAKFGSNRSTINIVDSPDGSGEQVLEINPDGTGAGSFAQLNPNNILIAPLSVVAGSVITISGDIYVPSGTGLNPDSTTSGLKVGFTNKLTGGTETPSFGVKATKTDEWERLYHTMFVSTNLDYVRPIWCNGFTSVGKKVYFRRLKIQSRNILTSNQATGTDALGNMTGFESNQCAISSSTEWSSEGTKSLKVVTEGANGRVRPRIPHALIKRHKEYEFSIDWKGTVGAEYRLEIGHGSTPWTILAESPPIAATGNLQTFSGTLLFTDTQTISSLGTFNNALIDGNDIILIIRQTSSGITTFYMDKMMLLNPITGFSPGVE